MLANYPIRQESALTTEPPFDLAAAHRYFSAECFNTAWDLMEKSDRTAEEDLLMVALSQASIYHWSQRPDCTQENLSIGFWQASRIQALLGNASEARRHAETCLRFSHQLAPFYVGYAYEALARAERLAGEQARYEDYLAVARDWAAKVTDEEDRSLLMQDLDSV